MNTRLAIIALMLAGFSLPQTAPPEQAGPTPDGGFLLNTGWKIKPAGTQIGVDTLPMTAIVTPDKKLLLVLNGGYNPPSVSVIDIATAKELSRAPVPDGWLGLTMTKAGDKVYVGGGSKAAIYEFSFAKGVLTPSRVFPIVAEKDRKPMDFIGDVEFSPDGRLLYAADLFHDSVVVVNPQSGLVLSRIKTGRRPYKILFHPSGKTFYVSSWVEGAISQYETTTGNRLANTRVGAHTTDMVWHDGPVEDQPNITARLFVSAGNTNNVYVLGATESGELSKLETISVASTPNQPLGSTPSGLGLSADGAKLFVACSDANAIGVVDIGGGRSRLLGFVPAGEYPMDAFGLPDGRIGALNAKSVQFVDFPDDQKLAEYTKEVMANSPYRDERLEDAGIPPNSPVRVNGPIKHVVYIIKGSQTYDRVLGDMKQGNGDASLALFGAAVTPNLHKLASEFVLLDNFHANAGSTAEGQNWAMAAIAPDYTRRLARSQAAGRRSLYDFEGGELANTPPAGYLWTNAAQAGISVRNYGEWSVPVKAANGDVDVKVNDPSLEKLTDKDYAPYEPAYADKDRADEFLSELKGFEASGKMPQLSIVRMSNDGFLGTTTVQAAAVADNDLGVGMLVEAISKSRFWNETAIFVVEAAADGPDHVEPHRAPAWVISPWVRKGTVNSTMFTGTSVLRTIEIILGIRPMTVFDAGARPMFDIFNDALAAGQYTLAKP